VPVLECEPVEELSASELAREIQGYEKKYGFSIFEFLGRFEDQSDELSGIDDAGLWYSAWRAYLALQADGSSEAPPGGWEPSDDCIEEGSKGPSKYFC